MTITSILNSGLSALLANQAALRTTSTNIANVNTPDYVRRTVQFETQTTDGILGGVRVGSIETAVDEFLNAQRWAASSESGAADAESRFLDQLQAALGGVSDGRDPASRISAMTAGLASLSTDPASGARRAELLQKFKDFAQGLNSLGKTIQDLRTQADAEIGEAVTRINSLTKRIAELNAPIQQASLSGGQSSALRDERNAAIQELSELIAIRVDENSAGRVSISTPSGYTLVNTHATEASHIELTAASVDTVFAGMTIVGRHSETGAAIGPTENFERHVAGGKLGGLLELRDRTLPDIASQLGALAAGTAEAMNAAHNAMSSYPAPATLTGRNTGLVATDSLGFSGRSSVAIVGPTGTLARRVDIDFTAGTLSVNGGPATAFTNTVGGLTGALNTALAGMGSASFANGSLSLSASGGNGVAVQQSPTDPAERAGRGFAQTFGLNDIFVSNAPLTKSTGLSSSDPHGFTAGQQVRFSLRDGHSALAQSFTYTVTGTTVGDMLNGLNASAVGAGTFSLNDDGELSFAPNGGSSVTLEISSDTTSRGDTGVSMTRLFGLGRRYQMEQATSLSVRSDLSATKLSFAQLDLTSTTAVGDVVLSSADNRGVLALQDAANRGSFAAAGTAGAAKSSLAQYATALVATIGQRAASAEAAASDSSLLKGDIETRVREHSGVSLDEELANMMIFQQAYNAGARLITTAQRLYDELINMMK